jgi:solute carrier family 35, member E1
MTESLEPRIISHRSLSPNSGVSEDSFNERFPSFDGAAPNHSLPAVSESPLETTQSVVPEYRWPPRRTSQRRRDSRPSGHRPRRSVSDALNKFRTRQGSVSENAHELAEALKAPVSYTLIVRRCGLDTVAQY